MRMGRVQRRVWDRANRSRYGLVKPNGWRERRACKRLADRALLKPALGYPDTWRNA